MRRKNIKDILKETNYFQNQKIKEEIRLDSLSVKIGLLQKE